MLEIRKPPSSAAFILPVFAVLAVFVAAMAKAGEPIPDIDVIIEQNPGGRVSIEALPPAAWEGDPVRDIPVVIYGDDGGPADEEPAAFDEVQLGVGRKTARSASVDALPRGWTLERDGKSLVMRGPALKPPARWSFLVDADARPESLDVKLLRGGDVLVERRQLVPRVVPIRQVRGSLTGVVRMPEEVSPGESLALRVLDDELPPGTFRLSGVVSEPFTEDELAVARTILNTTRSNIKLQAAILPGPLTLLGDGSCAELAPLAAMTAVERELGPEGATLRVSPAAARGEGPAARLSDLSRSRVRHEPAMGSVRNLRFFLAVKEEGVSVANPGGDDGISIKEKGVQVWNVTGEGDDRTTVWRTVPPPGLEEGGVRTVALSGEPVDGGCRFTGREAAESELVRWALTDTGSPWRPSAAFAAGVAVVHLVRLSDDLVVGDPLAVEYVDTWGEPWLDVPSAEGVEVVPPRPHEDDGSAIEAAAGHVLAGDLLCVCGRFGALDVAAPFAVGDVAGRVVGTDDRTLWVEVAAETPTGKREVTARGVAGRATTDVVRVVAELDQNDLLTGAGTTMRIRIEGTDRPLRLELTNGTPGVIRLEGGDRQTTETSGGSPNEVVREVRATKRGAFDLQWRLVPAACPCLETADRG